MATENAIRKSSELYDKAIDFDELERRLEDNFWIWTFSSKTGKKSIIRKA